jgi:acyl-CoA thioester hydrolase
MAHKTRIRVRFYELDPYNHVNHSVYIQYFETARIELLREAGLSLPEMMRGGLMIVVSEIHTKFLGPAEDGDELTIESEILEVKRVTARWRQRIVRDGAVIATQELRAAVVTADGRPTRFPDSMIEALEPYAAPDD